MPGRAADAISLDDRGKFKAQAHGLADLGLPAQAVAVDLAVADGDLVIGCRQRACEGRAAEEQFEYAGFLAHRRVDRDFPFALHHAITSRNSSAGVRMS